MGQALCTVSWWGNNWRTLILSHESWLMTRLTRDLSLTCHCWENNQSAFSFPSLRLDRHIHSTRCIWNSACDLTYPHVFTVRIREAILRPQTDVYKFIFPSNTVLIKRDTVNKRSHKLATFLEKNVRSKCKRRITSLRINQFLINYPFSDSN